MNWIELKALNELYEKGSVKKNRTLSESKEIKFLINSLGIIQENFKDLIKLSGFTPFYETRYLSLYEKYIGFLKENDLLKPQTRFELSDIEVLLNLQIGLKDGSLQFLKDQIIANEESLRGVSQMFFRNEKYLLHKEVLTDTLKKVLGISSLANEKDQQYIYKLETHNPKVIILCENLDFLKRPEKPRKYQIELWYAGGKNISKLEYADTRGLPIYYSCDWDYDGLLIYTWVKEKIRSIELLYPNGSGRSIVETEHQSLWKQSNIDGELFGLPNLLFTEEQKELIQKLATENMWIIEESNDIIAMLNNRNWPIG